MSVKGIKNQTKGIYDVQTIDIFDVFDVSISVLTLIVVTILEWLETWLWSTHFGRKMKNERKKKNERFDSTF